MDQTPSGLVEPTICTGMDCPHNDPSSHGGALTQTADPNCIEARKTSMAITLNHTIVPARDRAAAAQFFARIFGLTVAEAHDHFASVRVNDTLTLLFAN